MSPSFCSDAILHVGMPKCGSSALQTAFSHALPDEHACYVVIRADGTVLSGSKVKWLAETSATGYVPSANGERLAELSCGVKRKVRNALQLLDQDGQQLILSNEAWGNQYNLFAEQKVLLDLGLQCEVVLYVRPQVVRMNSAWWQWGAWSGKGFADWLENELPRADWHHVAASWAKVPGVTGVRVRLLPEDVVSDFFRMLDLMPPAATRSNASLPAELLRFFQMYPRLRSGPHRSEIEFALARHLRFGGNKTPWVMDTASVNWVIEHYRESNLRLLDLLDSDQKQQMEADPAWWDLFSYANRECSSPDIEPISQDKVEELAAAALEAVLDLDRANRELQRRMTAVEGSANRPLFKRLIRHLRKLAFGGERR